MADKMAYLENMCPDSVISLHGNVATTSFRFVHVVTFTASLRLSSSLEMGSSMTIDVSQSQRVEMKRGKSLCAIHLVPSLIEDHLLSCCILTKSSRKVKSSRKHH